MSARITHAPAARSLGAVRSLHAARSHSSLGDNRRAAPRTLRTLGSRLVLSEHAYYPCQHIEQRQRAAFAQAMALLLIFRMPRHEHSSLEIMHTHTSPPP
jgi:hypothetical protein